MKMKTLLRAVLPAALALTHGVQLSAQLNCDGITQMYGIFKEQTGANGNSYISPISYTTGVPGAAMPPGVFTIPRASNVVGGTAYGSTSLAADMTNHRFFYMTADYNDKDLWAANAITGVHTKIADAFPASLNGYYFVKASMAPNGFVYSLSTNRNISGTPDTKLIRWNSCATANCATIQVMAVIPNAAFNANLLYNGDLAFSSNGDMYIFGSEVNPATGTYVKASAFRIRASDIPVVPGTGSIPITHIGDVPSLDNTVISGFAFDGMGNYYLATIDQTTRRVSSIYKGALTGGIMSPVLLSSATYPGYILSDLATCVYPIMNILSETSAKLTAFRNGHAVSLYWKAEGLQQVRRFVVERNEGSSFRQIAVVPVTNPSMTDYQYMDEISGSSSVHQYRIRYEGLDGSYKYSNTVLFESALARTTAQLSPNPVPDVIRLDVTTARAGLRDLRVYDFSGNAVISKRVNLSPGANNIIVQEGRGLRSGVYYVQLLDGDEDIKLKMLKN